MSLRCRRLKEFKDTISLFIVTLDLNTRTYPIISQVHSLPYDCLALLPCPTSYGGVVVLAANSIFHVDQTGRTFGVQSNGWASRLTDIKLTEDTSAKTRNVPLEGARMMFVDERTIFVYAVDGVVYSVELVVEGRAVTNLIISSPLVQLTIPTVLCDVGGDHLFVGSTVGPSLLLKTIRVLEEIGKNAFHSPAAVVDDSIEADMDLDDGTVFVANCVDSNPDRGHLDIYGEKVALPQRAPYGLTNGHGSSADTRSVLHLSLRDSLREYGPISDMVFTLARNGVSSSLQVPGIFCC